MYDKKEVTAKAKELLEKFGRKGAIECVNEILLAFSANRTSHSYSYRDLLNLHKFWKAVSKKLHPVSMK